MGSTRSFCPLFYCLISLGTAILQNTIWENIDGNQVPFYSWGNQGPEGTGFTNDKSQMSHFSSVTQSCPTLCDAMDCSLPGLPVHYQLPEFTQIHVHWVGDAIQLFYPLSSPSPPAFNLSQHQGLFKWVSSSHQVAKVLEFHSTSVLPMNIQDWFPLGWTGYISFSPRDSQESSPTPQLKSISSLALSFLYSRTLTSIHDCWINHSLD